MPDMSTIFDWRKNNQEFSEQYMHAREVSAEALLGDILAISDDDSGDMIVDDSGVAVSNKVRLMRDRLKVDTRKWYLSKIMPKLYGDKLDVTSGGSKIEPPNINIINFKDWSGGDDNDSV